MNKGWPTGAVQLLNQRDVDLLLDQVEIDQQKELIAKGYFLANKNDLAIQYASEALVNSAEMRVAKIPVYRPKRKLARRSSQSKL